MRNSLPLSRRDVIEARLADGRQIVAASLAAEFNTHPSPQPEEPGDRTLIAIPPGYFFNWRFGARRRVPREVTVARWSNLLRRTAREGGVAHLWLHPHNLITAPDTAAKPRLSVALAVRVYAPAGTLFQIKL